MAPFNRGIGIFSSKSTEEQVLAHNFWRSLAVGGNFIRLLWCMWWNWRRVARSL